MEFRISEIINLALALASILTFIFFIWKKYMPKIELFLTGFLFMVCAYIFTIVEGIFQPDIFNILEHLSYALSGLFFAAGCWYIKNPHKKF